MGRNALWMVILVSVIAASTPTEVTAQNSTLRGFITDRSNGESLPGANVSLRSDDGELFGSAANNDGFYAVSRLEAGRYVIAVTFVGFRTHVDTLTFQPNEIHSYNVALAPSTEELGEIIVDAEREAGSARVRAGLQTVVPAEIDRIPSVDIAGDLASYLTLLPGVVTIGDQGGQFFIRGGEPWQNLVLLDGMLIYQPFHVLGFFSAFPSDILNSVDFYAGGFGAKYGGRISSVIDVTTRFGNKRRFAGAVTASPFVLGARVEGPLHENGRTSFLTSFRHSIIEQGATHLIDRPVPFQFDDFFFKLHSIPSRDSRFSVTWLQTYDRGKIGEDVGETPLAEVRWKNRAGGVRYLVLPGSLPILAEFRVGYSELISELGPDATPIRFAKTSRVNTSADMTFYGGLVDVKWGLFARTLNLRSELAGLFQNFRFDKEWLTEVGIYAEPEFKPMPGLTVSPSLRIHAFPSKNETLLEPRIRASLERQKHRFSGALGLYHQEIIGVSDRRDATSVFTAWAATKKGDGVPRAVHLILGYNYNISRGFDVAIEGFRKWYSNLFIAEWTAFPRLTTRIQPASGDVVGMDIRLEYRTSKFYGQVNYGLSSVKYDAKQESLQLWFGTSEFRFRPAHDRRHQVNMLASLKLGEYEFTGRWQFGSGLPYNRARGFDGFVLLDSALNVFEERGSRRVIYERPFNGILPTYHRLDISVERTFSVVGADITLQGSILNAYDRSNIFYLDVFTLRRANQLPFIPSFGVKVEVN